MKALSLSKKLLAGTLSIVLLASGILVSPQRTYAAFAIASTNVSQCAACGTNTATIAITPSGANRGVIIVASGTQGGIALSVDSVTVGGAAATVAADSAGIAALGSTAEVWYYLNPSASSQNVVVTWNNTFGVNGSFQVAVYAVTGMKQTSPVDNSDTVSGDTGTSIGTNLSMAIAAGAMAFVGFNDYNQVAVYDGTAGWTEDYAYTGGGDSQEQSAGHHLSAGATENPYANRAAYTQVSAAMASFLSAPSTASATNVMMASVF